MIRTANKIAQQPREDIVSRSSDFSMSEHVPPAILLRLTFGLFLLILLMSLAQRGAAQGVKFTSPVTYPAGHPYVVASGDFNGDGKMDLVAGDVTNNDLAMLLGNGDGTLKPAVTYHIDAAPHFIIANDFNRDGKLDLAIVFPYAAKIGIFLGKGDGSFGPPLNYPIGKFPTRIIAADFNRDGRMDLALSGGNNDIDILLGNGNGTFQNPQNYIFPEVPAVLAAGDFNGDGRIDLIVALRMAKTVNVFLGKGDGTFQTPISSTTNSAVNGSGALSVVVGDFDRDGKLDVALTDEYLKILQGNGNGTFKAPSFTFKLNNTSADLKSGEVLFNLKVKLGALKVPSFTFKLNNTSADLKSGDFNGDGKLDLVSAGVFSSGALQVLLGKGDGTFQDAGRLIDGSSSVSVVVTDLNGDTKPDLAANIGGQLTVALLNVTPGNPDNTDYFVHQHYVDFLDREPDAGGFDYWANQIASCGATVSCIDAKRTNVSAAFLLSSEFQQTAGLVERLYKTAYGDASGTSSIGGAHPVSVPIVRLNEFLPDAQQIGQDVIVGQAGWDTVLENNKQSFVAQFVQRPRFTNEFPTTLTPTEFVDKLNQNAGNVMAPSERATAVALFGSAMDTTDTMARAQALRQVAENQVLYSAEFNRAFVLMEYFGYLRRNANEGQDTDYSGYDSIQRRLQQGRNGQGVY